MRPLATPACTLNHLPAGRHAMALIFDGGAWSRLMQLPIPGRNGHGAWTTGPAPKAARVNQDQQGAPDTCWVRNTAGTYLHYSSESFLVTVGGQSGQEARNTPQPARHECVDMVPQPRIARAACKRGMRGPSRTLLAVPAARISQRRLQLAGLTCRRATSPGAKHARCGG